MEETLVFIDEGFLSKFSVSHHLIDCCANTSYLTKQDFLNSKLENL